MMSNGFLLLILLLFLLLLIASFVHPLRILDTDVSCDQVKYSVISVVFSRIRWNFLATHRNLKINFVETREICLIIGCLVKQKNGKVDYLNEILMKIELYSEARKKAVVVAIESCCTS